VGSLRREPPAACHCVRGPLLPPSRRLAAKAACLIKSPTSLHSLGSHSLLKHMSSSLNSPPFRVYMIVTRYLLSHTHALFPCVLRRSKSLTCLEQHGCHCVHWRGSLSACGRAAVPWRWVLVGEWGGVLTPLCATPPPPSRSHPPD